MKQPFKKRAYRGLGDLVSDLGFVVQRFKPALTIPALASLLLLSACGSMTEPGTVAMSFSWETPPVGEVWIWVQVEERSEIEQAGPILASVGPAAYTHGEVLALGLGQVPNGKNRVVVVEVREGASEGLPVLFYGLSAAFSVEPGRDTVVDIPLALQPPETQAHEPELSLLFDGKVEDTVGVASLARATIRTRSAAALSVTLANDASFSANLTTISLADADAIACEKEEVAGVEWDECEIRDWNLGAGLGETLTDGLYSVYVKFQDRYGYESQVYKASVMFDSLPPQVLIASITPAVAHADEWVYLNVSFHEPLGEGQGDAILTISPDGDGAPAFSGPERVGTSNAYLWTAHVPAMEVEDTSVYTFAVQVADGYGNSGDSQDLVNAEGASIEFSIDATPPAVVALETIGLSAALLGLNDEGVEFTFDFSMTEASPQDVGDVEGECTGICPRVRLGNMDVGAVSRLPGDDDAENDILGFRYAYTVVQADWGDVDKELDISIEWSDQAGNPSEDDLPLPLRLDFVRPQCSHWSLTPEYGNEKSTFVYSLTAVEPLAEVPTLDVSALETDLFADAPPPGDGYSFSWSQQALGLASQEFQISASLVDMAGNTSDGALCQASASVDGAAPEITAGVLTSTPEVVTAAGQILAAGGHEDLLLATFQLTEDEGVADGFPEVSLAVPGEPVPFVQVGEPEMLEGGVRKYTFSLLLDGVLHTGAEGMWPVRVTAYDLAGNATVDESLADQLVLVDFTPPAAECSMIPSADNGLYGAGQKITIQVSPLEELAGDTPPEMSETIVPATGAPLFVYESETNYRFSHTVVAEDGIGTFEVQVRMTDLVGNQTPPDATACSGGPVSGSFDPIPPVLAADLVLAKTLYGIESEGEEAENLLQFDFVLHEDNALSLPGDGACDANCPELRLSGEPLGTVVRKPELDLPDEGLHGFSYAYQVAADDWGAIDKTIPVDVAWMDAAGNVLAGTMADTLRFDFVRPTNLDCKLLPSKANAADMITYFISASEPLLYEPVLLVEGALAGLFELPPAVSGGGLTYTWQDGVDGLPSGGFTVSSLLTDLAANDSLAPENPGSGYICEMSAALDAVFPQFASATIETVPEVVDHAGQVVLSGGHEDLLRVSFVVEEDVGLGEDAPVLFLDIPGAPLPLAQVTLTDQGDGTWQAVYELLLDKVEHADSEGTWSVRALVRDAAGNETPEGQLGGFPVTLDFTPPVAQCALIPAPGEHPYPIGQKILLQVAPLEELELNYVPALTQALVPESPGDFFQFQDGTSYYFEHLVLEGEGEFAFDLTVGLRDLVGNETPLNSNACIAGTVSGASDGMAPTVAGITLTPDLPGWVEGTPVKAQVPVLALVTVENSAAKPQVWVAGQPMSAPEKEPVQLPSGAWLWEMSRTLDGTELQGPAVVKVQGADEAGNGYVDESQTSLVLDFTPPKANCIMNPALAKAGDTVQVTVYASEPLQGGSPAFQSDLEFLETAVGETEFSYVYSIDAVHEDVESWSYKVTLQDLAGNLSEGSSACTGSGSIDATPPVLVNGEKGITVSATHVKDEAAYTVSFYVGGNETLDGAPVVQVGNRTITLQSQPNQDGGLWVFGHAANSLDDPPDEEGIWPISVALTDTAGNQAFYSPGSITYDFSTPFIVGEPLLTLTPSPTCPLDDVEAFGRGATLQVTFTADGPLKETPEVSFQGEQVLLILVPNVDTPNPYRTTFTHTFVEGETGTLPAWAADEEVQVLAEMTDLAGNTATHKAGLMRVDTLAPGTPGVATSDRILYTRIPWGSDDTDGVKRFYVRGEEGAVDGDATVLVFDGPDPALAGEVGRIQADEGGAFGAAPGEEGALALVPADRKRVYVQAVDGGCNRSDADGLLGSADAALVADVRWVSTLGHKEAGSTMVNPHNLEARRWFTDRRRQSDADEPDDSNLLGMADDQAVRTDFGPSWWRRGVGEDNPGERYEIGLAYDVARERLVLFGGSADIPNAGNDVWEWDGASWALVAPVDPEQDGDPPAIRRINLVYDSVRNKCVTFGGTQADSIMDELWEWDGASWAFRTPVDPEQDGEPYGTSRRAMAFDSDRGVTVLVEGNLVTGDIEVWEWDGATWTFRPALGEMPPVRRAPAIAYDSQRHVVVMFGGADAGYQPMGDTWEWNGTSWSQPTVKDPGGDGNPSMRGGHAMAYDQARGVAVMFAGGPDADLDGRVWEWDGESWNGVAPMDVGDGHPTTRSLHAMTYEPNRQRVMMYGGFNKTDQLWEWDGASWRNLLPPQGGNTSPEGRTAFAMVSDPTNKEVLIAGGYSGQSQHFWLWDGDAWSEHEAPLAPVADATEGVFDSARGVFVVYTSGSLREYDGNAWATILPASPPEQNPPSLANPAMAFDSGREVTVLNGGQTGGLHSQVNDTWEWDGQNWAHIETNDPEGDGDPVARYQHEMVYDDSRGVVVLFSGFSLDGVISETWEYDGNSWALVQVEDPEGDGDPPPRFFNGMVYDPVRSRVLVFGGDVSGDEEDGTIWEYDGISWRRHLPSDPEGDGVPAQLSGSGMAYDYYRDRAMLFGGGVLVGAEDDSWEVIWGEERSPALVMHSVFGAAEETEYGVKSISSSWVAGGRGEEDGIVADGAALVVWDKGHWRRTVENNSFTGDWLSWTISAPLVIERFLIDGAETVSVGVIPDAPNGDSIATVSADYAQIIVDYRIGDLYGWGFDNDADTDGWIAENIPGVGEAADGIWTLPQPGGSSRIIHSLPHLFGNIYPHVQLRVRNTSKGAAARLWWYVGHAEHVWTESRSLDFTLETDGEWHSYLLAPHEATGQWNGGIEGLRIDLPDSDGVGDIAVDWVRLTD